MIGLEEKLVNSIFDERETDERHPSFDSEMSFYNQIAEGKVTNVAERWSKEGAKPTDKIRGILSDNPFRNAMYHFVAMTALITRACISHGLSQEIAYKLSDAYIIKADETKTPEGVFNVQVEMAQSFSDFMRNRNKVTVKSRAVAQCIDYINGNLHSSITVADLAEYVKLNETYLSKIFKRETGITISEYVRTKKIEEACWLLKFTDKTSIEISTALSFSSHSYFISVFRRVMGVTPKEYRNQNYGKQ